MSEEFPRQNWFRFKRLGKAWRRPRGGQIKIRLSRKSRQRKPNPGYGKPSNERFHVNGIKPILIENISQLNNIKDNEAVLLSSRIGLKNALLISNAAKLRGINIMNNRKVVKAEKVMLKKKRARETDKKSDIDKAEIKKDTDKDDTKEPIKKKIKE